MEKPYVISAELDLANAELQTIIRSEKIEKFRESLDADLRTIGKQPVWVGSGTLKRGLKTAVGKTRLPVVSLDDRYITSADAYIGISRGVDTQSREAGYVPRGGYPPLEQQLGKISTLGNEIVVADDVLFSGEMLAWLSTSLGGYGVKVAGVVCGIAVQEGIDKMQANGIDVTAVQTFGEVDDEICERDFAVVPGSGRRIAELDMNVLYFDPINGRPSQWASIPPDAVEGFAYASFERSADLLQPGLSFSDIGNFYGWDNSVLAANLLQEAAMWAYARATGVPPLG